MAERIDIGGRLHSTETGNAVAGANEILDDTKGKKQNVINQENDAALADRYTKGETYNKTELNNMITTPNQEYVTVATYESLPATGASDTVYRVSNWDGSQQDPSVYSEYAWNGSQYVHLSTKTQIGEVFDISAYHATGGELAKYADLTAALGTNGANIPQSLHKGGMSVKYVHNSDNKYVQCRCIADEFTTDVTQWQGVDKEPVSGSINIAESGGIALNFQKMNLLVAKYSIQTTSWYGENYNHVVIPVSGGETISFTKNGSATIYYALLTEYTTPVAGETPDFVDGYSGRRSATTDFTIPNGTKYLVMNNPNYENEELTSLKIDGNEIIGGIWNYANSLSKKVVSLDTSVSQQGAEISAINAANKSEIIKSNTNTDYIGARAIYEMFMNVISSLVATEQYNLFVTKYRGIINGTTGLPPTQDTPTSDYATSDYIPVSSQKKYYYKLMGSSSVYLIAEYDSSKNFLRGLKGGGSTAKKGIYIPQSDTAYICTCSSIASITYPAAFIDITDRLYAFVSEILINSIEYKIASDNIANPDNIMGGAVDNSGSKPSGDPTSDWKALYIPVTAGQVISFGGFKLGRSGYGVFYNGNTMIGTRFGYTDPDGTYSEGTLNRTVPEGATEMYIDIKSNSSPSDWSAANLMVNYGPTLLPRDEYEEKISSLNGIGILGAEPSLEKRVDALEDDYTNLDNRISSLEDSVIENIIADLPVSADGSGIEAGYAYIEQSTSTVKVKQA